MWPWARAHGWSGLDMSCSIFTYVRAPRCCCTPTEPNTLLAIPCACPCLSLGVKGTSEGLPVELKGAWRNRLVPSARSAPQRAALQSRDGEDGQPAEGNEAVADLPASSDAIPGAAMLCVLHHLQPNDKATSGRLLCKDAAFWLNGVANRTVDISKPLPPHVAASAPHFAAGAQAQLYDIPLRRKLMWLSIAAVSGCEANMQVAWRALQPSLFPELLQTRHYTTLYPDIPDPGTVAVHAGHPQLVPKLLDLCPGLIRPTELLAAAAKHSDFTGPCGLKATWQRLHSADGYRLANVLKEPSIMQAAMASVKPDAEHKAAWLVNNGAALPCDMEGSLLGMLNAAKAGGLDRLLWISAQVTRPDDRNSVLIAALMFLDLASAQQLLDMGRCVWPESFHRAAETETETEMFDRLASWMLLMSAAAGSNIEGVAKLQFLWQNWAPMDLEPRVAAATAIAAGKGALPGLRYLRESAGGAILAGPHGKKAVCCAIKAEDREVAAWLLQQGCAFGTEALLEAAKTGNTGTVQWLLRTAGVRPDGVDLGRDVIAAWPYKRRDSRALLQAVKLLAAAAAVPAALEGAAAPEGDGAGDRGGGGGRQPVVLSSALPAAASRGDLALVRYLVEELQLQRELSAEVISAAAGSGCEALLEWLAREQGCPVRGPDAWVRAGRLGDRAVLGCLLRLGVPWGQGLARAAADAGLPGPVLDWMEAEGAPVGRGEEAEAEEGGAEA